jgi:hypothetical protein
MSVKSIFLSVLAILAAAVPAAALSWWGWKAIGLTGVTLSLATALTAMVLALGLYAAMIALGRTLGILRDK